MPEAAGRIGGLALARGGVQVLNYQVHQPVERRVALLLPGGNFPLVELGIILLGRCVNDTIVVFDRIRENVIRHPERAFDSLVNLSIVETIGRSMNTSFTTLLVLLAMLLIGGPSIRGLLLVVAIGVVVGTYSSIFIAAQLLVIWERREFGRAFRWGKRAPAAAGTALLSLIGR